MDAGASSMAGWLGSMESIGPILPSMQSLEDTNSMQQVIRFQRKGPMPKKKMNLGRIGEPGSQAPPMTN